MTPPANRAERPHVGAPSPPVGASAVFLDRDGVINRRRVGDWVRAPEQLEILPGALEAIARLSRAGRDPIVITNQSGVGRGRMTLADVERVHTHLIRMVEGAGGRIRGILVCPHAPDEGCACRKPGVALFERAATTWRVELTHATMIGDGASDIEAARRAGLARALLVTDPVQGYPVDAPAPDEQFGSLAEAVDWLLSQPS